MKHKAEGGRRKEEVGAEHPSRDVLSFLLPPSAFLLCCALTATASAQQYPNRALRVVVPSSTGSGADYTARLMAVPLSERLGQQVVVENRAGAATMIGTELVAKAPPDGYTLLLAVGTLATVPAMYKKVPYDAVRDFAPIVQLVSVPNVLVVHPSLPARSVKELVALGRAHPGEIAFASAGTGTLPHFGMELFLAMTGTKMLHVPYKGPGPGMFDLISGRISAMQTSTAGAFPHIRSGRVRVLGVTTAKRASMLPEVPTIAEAGVPGYEAVQWFGLLAPIGTPPDIIARLHKESVAIAGRPETKERLQSEAMEVVAGSPQEFGAFIRAELEKWAKTAKRAGIQPE